jgi:hypothetical protein
VEVTISDNDTTTPNVALQFKDIRDNDVDYPVAFIGYFSTDTAGQALSVDGTDTTEIAVGTDGTILAELVADVMFVGVSEADGDFDLEVTVADGKTVYFNIVLPNGQVVTDPTAIYYTS